MPKNKNKGSARNYALESGVARFGRSAMYSKKAVYKFLKKKTAKKAAPAAKTFVEKKVGGAKNGGTRMVRVAKFPKEYPTEDPAAPSTSKSFFKNHKRSLRASLQPGTIAIVLAGLHKGKRVVVLKQLATGLLLITGPYKVNGCPLRRINQRYLIATQTKIDVSSVKVPEKLNDKYFKRARSATNKPAKKEGDIFESKKEEYKASDERKADQADLDKQLLAAISKAPEGAMLKQYLKATFGLSKGQFPHKMVF